MMRINHLLAIALVGALIVSTAIGATIARSGQSSVTLYAKPDRQSKVVATYTQNAPLTAFYRHGQWIKVGNSHNGTVGWISMADLQHNATKPHRAMQSVPLTQIHKTPYGNVQTTERSGTINGVHYRVITSNLNTNDQTPAQRQRWEAHLAQQQQKIQQQILTQEHSIDQQIQANLQQMDDLPGQGD